VYNFSYYLKKSVAIYPGLSRPVSAQFLTDHYRARARARGPLRKGFDWIAGGLLLAWIPWRARSVARRFGLGREWAKKAAAIARARFADPNDVALFRIESPDQMDQWMRRYEYAGINKLINPHNWRADCVLADKVAFAGRCAEHGIPHPTLLATIEHGRPKVRELPHSPDIVLKPAAGEGGSGVRIVEVPDGDREDYDRFAAFLARQSRGLRGIWLAQPRMTNDPAMADIALNALATVRLSTMLDEHGEPEVVTTVLRFPSRVDSLVDNIKAGGLMAPIDPQTGTLGPACQGRGPGEYGQHPVSGADIAGRVLPHWSTAVTLARRAHRESFCEYTLVGWDVALTADGPIILEGNGKPCLIVAQRANRRGVGSTRFGELIRFHLERANAHG